MYAAGLFSRSYAMYAIHIFWITFFGFRKFYSPESNLSSVTTMLAIDLQVLITNFALQIFETTQPQVI